ncbi:PolC-type DNA polymerase III [Virgibacillus halodenitrificans]|uniref:3'-5' exonuclease n=1 Tax=Virgibacillus halodenitrificans TaxID=1482 RepID=UPI0013CF20D4|nr:3'-5' exonuclease [Virgibacillus halodenitrificans]
MDNKLKLTFQLYLDQLNTTMIFYCDVPFANKKGYMHVTFRNLSQEDTFWKGLYLAVNSLLSYKQFPLVIGASQTLLSCIDGKDKSRVTAIMKKFHSLEFDESIMNEEELDKVNKVRELDFQELGKLKGFGKEELEERFHRKMEVNKLPIYNRFQMPEKGVVLDLETTSPYKEYARIIEVAALKFENGEIIEEFQTIVNPGPKVKVPKSIQSLTGITNEDIQNAPSTFKAIKKLNDFMEGVDVLVGHNIEYDYGVLRSFCQRFNVPLWEGSLLCTKRLAKNSQVNVNNYKLSTLCEVFGINNERPHRANADIKATYELLVTLYQNSLFAFL